MQKNLIQSLLDKYKSVFTNQILMRFGSTKSRFTKIYENRGWGNFESISGPGSSISETTEIRKGFEKLLKEYSIHSILDIPAGDFNWMKEVELSKINYLGADIVKELIEINKGKYQNSYINFIELNLIKDKLPEVDLIISRDCFIHFSYKDIFSSLKNIKDSNSKYLLVSTYPDIKQNINIRTGFNFNINLQIEPFNFPSPLQVIEEKEQYGQKHGRKCMALWAINDIILVK